MWELKRKLMYGFAVLITLLGVGVYFARGILFPDPTCFDGKFNGFETGVDCGGTCSLVCKQDVATLSVTWAKAVRVSTSTYDLVALVTNSNIDNASHELGYTFAVYDTDGNLIKSYSGSTTAPLDGKFPLIIQNIKLDTQPGTVVATITDTNHFKVNESPTSPTIKVTGRRYEKTDISRLYVTIANTKRLLIHDLPVRVLLFDSEDNVYAVGQTVVPTLDKEQTKEIIVTWNPPLPFAPTRIDVYPIFDPFDALVMPNQ